MKISLIQYSAGQDVKANFAKVTELINKALIDKPDVICTPENFLLSGAKHTQFKLDSKEILAFLDIAKQNNVNLILGSINITGTNNKYTNSCLVINRKGKIVHRYDKVFMYTVNKQDVQIDEAQYTQIGDKLGICELDGVKIGVAICVDMRFASYFEKLARAGAEAIFLPAAMRKLTGAYAWEVIPPARAIESQVYLCPVSQVKNLGGSKAGDCCGRSRVISYDGTILAELDDENEGVCTATIDLEKLKAFRKELPMLDQFSRIDKIKE